MSGPDTSRFELSPASVGVGGAPEATVPAGGASEPTQPTESAAAAAGPLRADDGDLDLLRRHVAGDPDAFVELFQAHRHRLWRVALGLLGDAGDAEDALQDAMLSAHRKAADFEARASVATWLHRIVVNAALTQLRRRKVRPTSPMPTDAGGADLEPPDPRDAVAEADLHFDVMQALAGLPEEMRTTVVLVDVHGYPVAEVARLLSVPEGTVKSRCSRGRARLALALGHLRPGNPSAVRAVSLRGHNESSADRAAAGGAEDGEGGDRR